MSTVTDTTEGLLRGTIAEEGVRAFLAVPFAQPPVGPVAGRLSPATAAVGWDRSTEASGPANHHPSTPGLGTWPRFDGDRRAAVVLGDVVEPLMGTRAVELGWCDAGSWAARMDGSSGQSAGGLRT